MTARPLALFSALALLWAGCGETITQEYRIRLQGPFNDENFLAGATTAVLEAGGKEYRTAITPGAPFTIAGGGIDVKANSSTIFKFRALDPSGRVVAQGQSQQMEIFLATPPQILVFVQKPGTFARTFDLDYPRREIVAAPGRGTATFTPGLPLSVAFFGLGRVITETGAAEQSSEAYAYYNPLINGYSAAGMSAPIGNVRQPRTGAATTLHPDGRILIFGGVASPPMMPPGPTSQLDIIQMFRTDFAEFEQRIDSKSTTTPGVARSRTALVHLDVAYAIGGRAGDQVLDTVVRIAVAMDQVFTLLPARMATPRDGHTATVANVPGAQEVLVFGGAPSPAAGAALPPVAEVLAFPPGGTPAFVPVMGNAGPPRRDHVALALPGGDRVIVIGGRNDAGVLGDSVLYTSLARSIGPGSITLATPRWGATAFLIGQDLVVAGGYDAAGVPIGNAEVFNADNLAPRAVVPAFQRAGAAVAQLPNNMALLMGGTKADGLPTSVVEIYQPHVP